MAVKSKLSKASPMKKFAANCVAIAKPVKKVSYKKDDKGNIVTKDGKKVTVTTYNVGARTRFGIVKQNARSIVYYLCLKQPSKPTVNYQVQYKYGYRSTSTGKWSESGWKNCYSMGAKSKLPAVAYGSTYNADYWLRANLGRKDTTLMWLPVNGHRNKSGIDKIKRTTNFPATKDGFRLKFRVRTVLPNKDAKKVVHGPWNSDQGCTVTYLRKIASKGVAAYRQIDGGFIFDYDFKPTGKVVSYEKVCITSIVKAGTKTNLLKSAYAPKMMYDSTRKPVTGYTKCGTISVGLKHLKDTIDYNTKYQVKYYIVDDGVKQEYTSVVKTKPNDATIPIPTVSASVDDNLDLNVEVPYLEGEKYKDIACVATYTLKGKSYKALPDDNQETLKSTERIGYFKFTSVPPKSTIRVYVSFTEDGRNSRMATYKVSNKDIGTQVFLKSVSTKTKHIASVYGDIDMAYDSKGKSSIEMTYGRELPFAVFSKSTDTSISLKGTASNIPFGLNYMIPLHEFASIDRWNDIRENQHELYWLVIPDGKIHKVAIESISISSTVPDYATVNVKMREVS